MNLGDGGQSVRGVLGQERTQALFFVTAGMLDILVKEIKRRTFDKIRNKRRRGETNMDITIIKNTNNN